MTLFDPEGEWTGYARRVVDTPDLGKLDTNPHHHARADDPDTSHEAAATVDVSRQARRILAAYALGDALLDVEAYSRVGFPVTNNRGQRCSDLRSAGFIERTGNRRRTANGKAAHECRITAAGLTYLRVPAE